MVRLRSLYGLILALPLAIASMAVIVIDYFLGFLFDPRAARPVQGFGALGYAGPSMTGVPSALFQRGRHEAGMSRRSAARNI